MDNKYTPIGRKTITEKHIPLLVNQVKDSIKRKLQAQLFVSVTADIWSDRTMRSFFGVTAHGFNQEESRLESFLLDCRRFCGKHSGENIAMAFDEIVDEYNIASKVEYIITDNAANMKCAFKVKLPQDKQHSDDSDAEDGDLDDESLWEDVTWEDETVLTRKRQRLSCFAHSLQLVVHDGMKEAKAFSSALAKCQNSPHYFTQVLSLKSDLRLHLGLRDPFLQLHPHAGIAHSGNYKPLHHLTIGLSPKFAVQTFSMFFFQFVNGISWRI